MCVLVRVSVCVCKSLSFLMCKDAWRYAQPRLPGDMRNLRSKMRRRRRRACRACIRASKACRTCIRACRTCCIGCRVWRGYRQPAEHTNTHRKKKCIRRIHRAHILHKEFFLRNPILPAYLSLPGIGLCLCVKERERDGERVKEREREQVYPSVRLSPCVYDLFRSCFTRCSCHCFSLAFLTHVDFL